ncbi:MAG: alpha-isopropylmalate synthase regulatory domain-containing protein [archaeon]
MAEYVQVMDTTLRDGEQTRGMSFSAEEKLSIAKLLLKEVKVDRIEVASARVSQGEKESVKAICAWAKNEGLLERIEVLAFVDEASIDWAFEAGCRTINLLAKGSKKHCELQLRKKPEEHYADAERVIKYAKAKGMGVNVYLEDWSNGIKDSKEYVFAFTKRLKKAGINRLLLPDTLGVLDPLQTQKFVREMKKAIPLKQCDFHGHNDYGLGTANALVAVAEGIRGVHCTINGLGERTGNSILAEVVATINDKTNCRCGVDESALVRASKYVERVSGKKVSENKPIVGDDVFTQTAGIHADGDMKGNLYVNPLTPERFGRKREYALGKLSGKSSLEQNLRELHIELTPEQKKLVLAKIVELGDKKETVTPEDLPFIISDVLKTPLEKKAEILECKVFSNFNGKPKASLKIKLNGKTIAEESEGDGGYDAFMQCLKLACTEVDMKLPELTDYSVRIPPGGKTDALVETTITWRQNGKEFRTIGIDSDQVMAAVKATEKMLNQIMLK